MESTEPLKLKKYRMYEVSFGRTAFVVNWSDIKGNTSGIILHDNKSYKYIESNYIESNAIDTTPNSFEVEIITKLNPK